MSYLAQAHLVDSHHQDLQHLPQVKLQQFAMKLKPGLEITLLLKPYSIL
jgi:hypothetical protein